MSRYSLKPLPHRADLFEVAVGWDPGLSTYFAIVFGVPECDFDPVITSWHGRVPDQLSTVAALECVLHGCAVIPADLSACLAGDKRASQAHSKRPISKISSTILSYEQ
jgi:hypothetical protein